MDTLRKVIYTAAIVVFSLCFYAFLLGNKVFDGNFNNLINLGKRPFMYHSIHLTTSYAHGIFNFEVRK